MGQTRGEVYNSLGAALPTIGLLTTVFFVNFTSRIILGPLAPIVETELSISHGETGTIFLLISGGYCLSISLSGFVSSRLGHRRTILVSAMLLAFALGFTAWAGSLRGVRLGFLFVGVAAGLYLPSGMATMTGLLPKGLWGRAIAIHELAPNLGFVAAPFVTDFLYEAISWRGILGVFAVLSAASALALMKWGRGGGFAGVAPNPRSLGRLAKDRDFWLIMGIFGMGVGGSLGVYAMLPLFLVASGGWEISQANSIVGLSRIVSTAMAFVGGWASDRFGPSLTISVALVISGFLTISIAVLQSPWLIVVAFAQPAFAVCFFPAALAAMSRIGPLEVRSLTVSLVVPLGFLIGGGGMPAIVGYAGDQGMFDVGFALVGSVMILGGMGARLLRLDGKNPRGHMAPG